jgi:hypothetical protein
MPVMLAFWPDIIRPLFDAIEPRSIVEIGSEAGRTTRLLLEFACRYGGVVNSIDPGPSFDVAAWQKEFGENFVFHRLPSLVGLCGIDRMDVVLIDGDHNWFTVFNELKLIESRCLDQGRGLPLILLHDVGWPYGRRDLYYAPEAIPAEHRQPWARKGISPSRSELLDHGGYNAKMCNALKEGGAKNGVMSAVEDYLAQTIFKFKFVVIPAVFGLGILLPEPLAAENPELARRVHPWTVPEIHKFIERMEMARISMLTGV